MWTISDEQLKAVSASMRGEFERRACCAMEREMREVPPHVIRHVVHIQTDQISTYNIGQEDSMMRFIRLSFEYPALQSETLPETVHNTLSSSEDEYTRIEKLINLLKTDNYGF
jgi:hypothetical protein